MDGAFGVNRLGQGLAVSDGRLSFAGHLHRFRKILKISYAGDGPSLATRSKQSLRTRSAEVPMT
jgi:hypothetical protein